MNKYRQVRALYDRESIVVYQAYSDKIAKAVLSAGKFVAPFSWRRMTWIKPSFLWLMARSGWGTKKGQENILAIRMKRTGWEKALQLGVLTCFEPGLYPSVDSWRNQFTSTSVHVQWDPERTINGRKLDIRSIQVGISRDVIREFTDDWVLEISDYTGITRKIRASYLAGNLKHAKRLLPKERIYDVGLDASTRLGITGYGA